MRILQEGRQEIRIVRLQRHALLQRLSDVDHLQRMRSGHRNQHLDVTPGGRMRKQQVLQEMSEMQGSSPSEVLQGPHGQEIMSTRKTLSSCKQMSLVPLGHQPWRQWLEGAFGGLGMRKQSSCLILLSIILFSSIIIKFAQRYSFSLENAKEKSPYSRPL